MECRIEKKDEFRIVGISQPFYHEVEKNFEIVPQMWQKAAMNGTLPKLAGIMNGAIIGMLDSRCYLGNFYRQRNRTIHTRIAGNPGSGSDCRTPGVLTLVVKSPTEMVWVPGVLTLGVKSPTEIV